jgi:hypothetical protein
LERIASLEKESRVADYCFSDELLEALGRFILPERRALFSILERIPKSRLDKGLGIDEKEADTESSHVQARQDAEGPGASESADAVTTELMTVKDVLQARNDAPKQDLPVVEGHSRSTPSGGVESARVDMDAVADQPQLSDGRAPYSSETTARASGGALPEGSSSLSKAIAASPSLQPYDDHRRSAGDESSSPQVAQDSSRNTEFVAPADVGARLALTVVPTHGQTNETIEPEVMSAADASSKGDDSDGGSRTVESRAENSPGEHHCDSDSRTQSGQTDNAERLYNEREGFLADAPADRVENCGAKENDLVETGKWSDR